MTRHEGGRRITRKSLAAWLLAAAVAFAGIGIGLHAAWESRFAPLAQLSRDWGVRFPTGAVVTEHESDQGFDGDGYSYTVIRMRTGADVDGTILDDDIPDWRADRRPIGRDHTDRRQSPFHGPDRHHRPFGQAALSHEQDPFVPRSRGRRTLQRDRHPPHRA